MSNGVKRFPGSNAGATAADLERGYLKPGLIEGPEYDIDNYKMRLSHPARDDVNPWSNGLPDDYEFRSRNVATKGFLTRQREPRERN